MVRVSRPAWRLGAVGFALLLGACSPVASPSASPGQPALGLAASSSGVCEAIAALPDLPAARRAFTDLAHEPLHGLAGEPRLDRSLSAGVLEAMERVEADFSQAPDVTVLADDLAELHRSADAALGALGVGVPVCAQ